MSDTTNYGFAKLIPGFDFLQNLAKGASGSIPQLPNPSNWVAPTLNVEELEKRISELKAVHFWLDQNSKALSATIQALEVQKMTLATLQGMNFNLGDVANALRLKTAETMSEGMQKITEAAEAMTGAAKPAAHEPETKSAAKPAKARKQGDGHAAPAAIDPMQWWGALTQQFQEIASNAMKDAAHKTAANTSLSATAPGAAKAPRKTAARKSAASKAAPRKRAGK